MNALANVQLQDRSLMKLSPQEASLLAKAEGKLGAELIEITQYSRIYNADDMRQIIAIIDANQLPASKDEATSLAAILIAKCRAHGLANGPIGDRDFKIYAVGLGEAFLKFPATIGQQAVNGGTGLPSTSAFWPKPFDVVQFCKNAMAMRSRAKVMAQRHITESKRRSDEDAERRRTPEKSVEERRAFVAKVMANSRLKSMSDA